MLDLAMTPCGIRSGTLPRLGWCRKPAGWLTWEETHYRGQSQKESREILDLRDAEGACVLLKQHVLGMGKLLVERLESRQLK